MGGMSGRAADENRPAASRFKLPSLNATNALCWALRKCRADLISKQARWGNGFFETQAHKKETRVCFLMTSFLEIRKVFVFVFVF